MKKLLFLDGYELNIEKRFNLIFFKINWKIKKKKRNRYLLENLTFFFLNVGWLEFFFNVNFTG